MSDLFEVSCVVAKTELQEYDDDDVNTYYNSLHTEIDLPIDEIFEEPASPSYADYELGFIKPEPFFDGFDNVTEGSHIERDEDITDLPENTSVEEFSNELSYVDCHVVESDPLEIGGNEGVDPLDPCNCDIEPNLNVDAVSVAKNQQNEIIGDNLDPNSVDIPLQDVIFLHQPNNNVGAEVNSTDVSCCDKKRNLSVDKVSILRRQLSKWEKLSVVPDAFPVKNPIQPTSFPLQIDDNIGENVNNDISDCVIDPELIVEKVIVAKQNNRRKQKHEIKEFLEPVGVTVTGHFAQMYKFRCNYCDNVFRTKLRMLRHEETHSEELGLKCSRCDAIFYSLCSLYQHEYTHESHVTCDYCKKNFPSKSLLRSHIKLFHLVVHCAVCDKVFSSDLSLRNHVAVHTKPFKCSHCSLSFTSDVYLDRHVQLHLSKFQCEHCLMFVGRLESLKAHISLLHSKPRFSCYICNKSLYSQNALKKHNLLFHLLLYKGKFSCDLCGKSYRTSRAYKRHLNVGSFKI